MKRNSLFNYLLIITLITVIFLVIYATVQQSYRTGADDPQIQMTRDINVKLHDGKSVESYFNDTINIARSLSPFVVLFNAKGEPFRSSGYLDGKMPELSKGVFDFAKKEGEHAVTWQPKIGVRMAIVILYSNSLPVSFVAAGRSLEEVEIREGNLVTIVFIGWIICVAMVLVFMVIHFYTIDTNNRKCDF